MSGSFSIWHWLIFLFLIGFPLLLWLVVKILKDIFDRD